MPQIGTTPRRAFDPHEAEAHGYRALSGLAVGALLFALLSPAAMISPILWALPATALVLAAWALRRIAKSERALAGRNFALWALVPALVFAAAAPTETLVYRCLIHRQARQVAGLWFEALANGEPQKAHQLVLDPRSRETREDKLWEFYREGPHWRRELQNYAADPLVRTLLALGHNARSRFYQVVGEADEEHGQWLQLLYAVSFRKDDSLQSFFVRLTLERQQEQADEVQWRLDRAEGGIRPEGF
ncbi:MAG: hypothetical protein ABSG68_21195 [Thermoguttaceae bacterium]